MKLASLAKVLVTSSSDGDQFLKALALGIRYILESSFWNFWYGAKSAIFRVVKRGSAGRPDAKDFSTVDGFTFSNLRLQQSHLIKEILDYCPVSKTKIQPLGNNYESTATTNRDRIITAVNLDGVAR